MDGDVLARRAEIESAIEGRTICDDVARTAVRSAEEPAFSDVGPDGGWATITWAQAHRRVLELAAGLVALGLEPGDRVALMMPNRLEHIVGDLGVVHAGGIPVTFYSTLAPEQVAFMAADCDARIAILGSEADLARWRPVLAELPGLRTVVVVEPGACPDGPPFLPWTELEALGRERLAADPEAAARRVAAIRPDDPVTLLYTSGTTGNPKGVIITHRNVLYEVEMTERQGTIPDHVRWVSYLPLAHIAERVLSIYIPIRAGAHVYFCRDATTDLVRTVGSVKPNSFFGVPRVWEKIQAGIQALLSLEADPEKKAATAAAMDAGRRYVEGSQFGRSIPDGVAEEFRKADAAVLGPMRSLLGLADLETALSAAAPLPPDVAVFFAGLGIKILDVYGMTETTGAFTANNPAEFKLGTVGRPVPGMEVMIAPDGEILVRGPLNSPGYLNLQQKTAELIDADGWLHTGDVGSLDADGFLSVVDRKKELIITSGGENISPAGIENLLVAHPLVGQALAFGDRRPYVIALLTLDAATAPAWARQRGVEADSLAVLAENPEVLNALAEAVAQANARLARVQQVKRFAVLAAEWTAESEELTPTLKLKRRVIHAKYADAIDALYAG